MNVKIEQPVVFFDLETTGLDAVNDRIVELYMTKVNVFDWTTIDELYLLINPGCIISEAAIAIHHITNEQVANSPSFSAVAKQIFDFIGDCYICGYNSNRYDVLMLSEELNRCDLSWPSNIDCLIDIYDIERTINSHSLVDTYKRYFGVNYEDTIGAAHGAKADTLATIAVAKAQITKLGIDTTDNMAMQTFKQTCKSNANKVDIAGLLVKNADNVICYNFGKNIGKPVISDTNYAMWMLNSAFAHNTKQCIREILNK